MRLRGIPSALEFPSMETIQRSLKDVAEFLCLPTYDEYRTVVYESMTVNWHALCVNWNFIFITFRPLFILLSWASKHVAWYAKIFSSILLNHLNHSLQRFVAFQLSLSKFAILTEVSIVLSVIGAYLLRQYIRRKRYVERLRSWRRSKALAARKKYDEVLDEVARTSTTLAMVLPHLMYFSVAGTIRYAFPDFCIYIANELPILEGISIIHPAIKTISLVEFIIHIRRELTNTEERAIVSIQGKQFTNFQLKREEERVSKRLQWFMRYWITFALLHGFDQFFSTIPILSRLFNRALDTSTKRQVMILLFIWLKELRLPSANTMGNRLGKHASGFSNNTVDIIYKNVVSSIMLPLTNATAAGNDKTRGLKDLCIKQVELFLAAMVFMKAIALERKEQVIFILSESFDLLPASITLLMPSMFTFYGIIYVTGFIATGNSAKCDELMSTFNRNMNYLPDNDSKLLQVQSLQLRWLRYWCVYSISMLVLKRSEYALSWIPLSTHATLAYFIWLQLPALGGSPLLYKTIRFELTGFGILAKSEDFDPEDTLTLRLLITFFGKDSHNERIEDFPGNEPEQ